MKTHTTINLTEGDVERLLDALLGQFPENLSDEENAHASRLIKRLNRASDRLSN